MSKKRLDLLVLSLMPHISRTKISSLIMQGKVIVDGRVITKAGMLIDEFAAVVVDESAERYVGRAGYKLEHALQHFAIDVQGLVALDAGISTGGFTDCLLQHGVAKVYGVDVGYGQVHEKIRADTHVQLLERTNLRYLTQLSELVDLVTLDLSFISVLKVLPAVIKLMKPDARLIILIKPQFEAERADVQRGGLITDAAVHQRVIDGVVTGVKELGFVYKGVSPSPILGATGNQEFLAYFIRVDEVVHAVSKQD